MKKSQMKAPPKDVMSMCLKLLDMGNYTSGNNLGWVFLRRCSRFNNLLLTVTVYD